MNIDKSFRHTEKLSDDAIRCIKACEDMFVETANELNNNLPESREKSLCLTKLQEAKFWAIECIAKVIG